MKLIKYILYLIEIMKKEDEMVAVYVTLIIKGKRTFTQVPEILKEEVRQMLIDLDLVSLIEN